jgi:hypothetical protein
MFTTLHRMIEVSLLMIGELLVHIHSLHNNLNVLHHASFCRLTDSLLQAIPALRNRISQVPWDMRLIMILEIPQYLAPCENKFTPRFLAKTTG